MKKTNIIIVSMMMVFLFSGQAKSEESPNVLGMNAFNNQDYDKAKVFFIKANELEPVNPIIIYNLGITYYYLKEYVAAKEKMTIAISLKPEFAEAYHTRGTLNIKQTHMQVAASDFKKGCDLGYQKSCRIYNNLWHQ
jgi:tetratricopeptide (TPR) repeat protein